MTEYYLQKPDKALVLSICLLLSACATPASQQAADEPAKDKSPQITVAEPAAAPISMQQIATETATANTAEEVADSSAPKPEFRFQSAEQEARYKDSLYKTLLAEMAGYRGYYTLSAQYYYDVAVQTQNPEIAERATQIALYAKDYQQTQRAAELWSRLSPDNADARQIIIAMLLRDGKKDQAFAEIEQMLDSLSEVSDQRLETLIKLLRQGDDHEGALKIMGKLLDKRPDDIDIALIYARLLLSTQQWERGEVALNRVLSLDPDNSEAIKLYLQLQVQQGKGEQAISWMSQRLQSQPDNQEWRLHYARLLLSLEKIPEAIKEYETLHQNDPEDEEFLYTLGLMYLQEKQFEQAEAQLKALLQKTEEEEHIDAAHYFLGQIAEEHKQWQAAVEEYRQVGFGVHYLGARARMALSLIEQNKLDEGLDILHKTEFSRDADKFRFLRLEAEILMEREHYAEAQTVLQNALDEFPDNADLLYSLSMSSEKLERYDLMESYLKQIIKAQPHNADALNALGYTLADRTQRYGEARELIEQALAQKPNAHYILDSMGWVLYRQGEYAKSITYLRRALSAQDDPEIAAHLGEVLWVSGEQAQAKQVWQDALKRFPDDPALLKVLKQFQVQVSAE